MKNSKLYIWLRTLYHSKKDGIQFFIEYWYWRIKNWIKYHKNDFIRKQLKNPYSIPVIIISFNQLFYLNQLVNFLLKRGFSNIVIIDNNSTYPPLLDYFDSLSENNNITIHKLSKNIGNLVFWKESEIYKKY